MMRTYIITILWVICFSFAAQGQNSTASITGTVLSPSGKAIDGATVKLKGKATANTTTDAKGSFYINNLEPGKYRLSISHVAYQLHETDIVLKPNEQYTLNINLGKNADTLAVVNIVQNRFTPTRTFLPDIRNTDVYIGKKNEVIDVTALGADLAENNPRQVFAKLPGAMIWEMDGTGNQVGVATRGLIPHRSWEMNVRQNGNVINSDLFGYPETHYNMPMEAVGRIELVRGSGALQYGPQFGGMLNYIIKEPDTTRKIGFTTQQSAGSFGLFNTYNQVDGKVGKFSYLGYLNFRRSDGWRQNSDYKYLAWHVGLRYDFNSKIYLKAEISHMEYVNHFGAGLTDSMFAIGPKMSNRSRNYFNPTIYVPSILLHYQIAPRTLITARASAIFGQRNSVQIITSPLVQDTFNTAIGSYNPRQVDRDWYHSYYNELKLLQSYPMLGQTSYLTAGIQVTHSKTYRRQLGGGTTASNFDLSLTSPYKIDLTFLTTGYAVFAENVFNFTKHFSITPGIRFDHLQTTMKGVITAFTPDKIPLNFSRNFPLLGVGTEYKINDQINVYANFTQNYRPILHSDILPSNTLTKADPNLKDSKGFNGELGIRGTWKNFMQFDVNYFALRYNDRIGTLIVDDTAGTYFYKTNIGDMLNQGTEVYVELQPFNLMKRTNKYLDFSFFTSTSYNAAYYTKGTVSSGGKNVDIKGNRVENVPHWISRNGVSYRYSTFMATFQVSYVSANYSDALNTEHTASGINGIVPSYVLMDVNLSYSFLKHYNIKFSLNNLANHYYFTRRATGYPGPGVLPSDGRSFVVSVGAKF